MKHESRRLFTDIYTYVIYLGWIVGFFLLIHNERIYTGHPLVPDEIPRTIIAFGQIQLFIMTIILYLFNKEFAQRIDELEWPSYWTEGSLCLGLSGAYLHIIRFLSIALYQDGQPGLYELTGFITPGGFAFDSFLLIIGIISFIACAVYARIMK